MGLGLDGLELAGRLVEPAVDLVRVRVKVMVR